MSRFGTIVVLHLLAAALAACASVRPADEAPRELVVLVHGMGRTPLSMVPMAMSLRRAGYRVLNVGYDSQGPGVAEIGAAVHAEVTEALADEPAPRVHFVGHSLGTVVIRWLLVSDLPLAAGRAVLLAPPNQGAQSADRWAPWLGWSMPPIRELRTSGGTAADLGPPPDVEVAVIAGARDGKVTVEETCLAGAAHAVVPSGHTVLMMRPQVMDRVKSFLASGDLPGASDDTCDGESVISASVSGASVERRSAPTDRRTD